MDWKLAKNYTIIFLIILNLILFFINLINSNDYKISQSQKSAIINYLSKNDISIYSDLPSQYYPMQQLKTSSISYDYFTLQDIFFKTKDNIKRTEEFSNTIFSNENEILTIYPTYIYYQDKNKIDDFDYSKNNVIKISEQYISEIKKFYTTFELNRTLDKKEYFLIEYYQKFNQYTIFNNYVIFKIYTDGTKEIYFYYLEPENFSGSKIDICSVDEALYVFAREIKKLSPSSSFTIKQIDLGYFTQELDKNNFLTPFYRFYISGLEEPFYVNAYTNTFVNK